MLEYEKPFLGDFARVQWTSARARAIWEPRITAIGAQFHAAELEAVEAGIRPAALQFVTLEGLPELSAKAAKKGLALTVLGLEQVGGGSYSAGRASPGQASSSSYRVVLTRPDRSWEFVAAWTAGDDHEIGRLLGYPDCCRRFFFETWAAGSVDPTGYMGRSGTDGGGPHEANILLRWAGVRYVPHMPCAFECPGSIKLGRLLRELVAPLERGWADELLMMPMEWTALNSIGEVVTPLFTVNFRTDPAPERREIRRSSSSYPEGSAVGLRFPYMRPGARKPREQPATLATLDAQGLEAASNGFGSWGAMERAHASILSVRPANGPRTVLDLGAGTGRLARALAGAGGTAIGVEVDPERARRAEALLDAAFSGDMFSDELESWIAGWEPELVLFMPGRLLEQGAPPANLFLERLQRAGGELLVYAYGDWLDQHETLEGLCNAAGLVGELEELQADNGVEAGVWRWI